MASLILARNAALLALVVSSSGTAGAVEHIVDKRGWERVAQARQGDCRAEVRGNGKFYRIAGSGFQPGEVVSFHLENEDIKPIEYRILADRGGAWEKFYLPFLWGRAGGTVSVSLASASCRLQLSFDWSRDTGGYEARSADIRLFQGLR